MRPDKTSQGHDRDMRQQQEARPANARDEDRRPSDRDDAHHIPGAEGPLGAEAEEDNNP